MKSQRTFIRSCGKGQGTNTLENLVLIGYMGSGKTTVGKTLAKMMQFSFLDTDEMIEKQQNKTIREIFAAVRKVPRSAPAPSTGGHGAAAADIQVKQKEGAGG